MRDDLPIIQCKGCSEFVAVESSKMQYCPPCKLESRRKSARESIQKKRAEKKQGIKSKGGGVMHVDDYEPSGMEIGDWVDYLEDKVGCLEKENQELKDLLRLAHEDATKLTNDLQGALIV
jgi:hypothetical protein